MGWKIGDIVSRYSYDHDLLFRVQTIKNDIAILYGEDFRLQVDAPLDDLKKIDEKDRMVRKKEMKKSEQQSYRMFHQDYYLKSFREGEANVNQSEVIQKFRISPKVLHVDGDSIFLRKCIHLYKRLGLQVHGVYVSESEMPLKIKELTEKIQPDILVITGHDSYSKQKGNEGDIRAYRNSKYFVESVREARKITPNLDQLVIFAGACQSHFESLIKAGANFASSPTRINIHALDPVYVVAKVGYTPFMEKVNIFDVVSKTVTREKGIGGIETKGLLRIGLPYLRESPVTNEQPQQDSFSSH